MRPWIMYRVFNGQFFEVPLLFVYVFGPTDNLFKPFGKEHWKSEPMKTYDRLAFSQAYSTAPRAMYVELVYGFYSLFLILFTYCGTGIWFRTVRPNETMGV